MQINLVLLPNRLICHLIMKVSKMSQKIRVRIGPGSIRLPWILVIDLLQTMMTTMMQLFLLMFTLTEPKKMMVPIIKERLQIRRGKQIK